MLTVRRLGTGDSDLFAKMLDLYGTVFNEPDTYGAKRPSPEYVTELLENPMFVALVGLEKDRVVGALAAYELPKFEQARSEFYIYDLAVDAKYRRQGIATTLINETRKIAENRGGWVVFVQADLEDAPAIALYTKLGIRENVLHFDIDPDENSASGLQK